MTVRQAALELLNKRALTREALAREARVKSSSVAVVLWRLKNQGLVEAVSMEKHGRAVAYVWALTGKGRRLMAAAVAQGTVAR